MTRNDTMTEYIIVGDNQDYNGCLIYVCGTDQSWAEQVLQRMLNHPTENDIKSMGSCTDLRVEEVLPENCWWNDTTD